MLLLLFNNTSSRILSTQTKKKVSEDYDKLDSLTSATTKLSSSKDKGEEDKENKLNETEKRLERATASATRSNYGLRDKDARK